MPSEALAAFLAGETDARSFRHLDHLRMGFELLQTAASFSEAAAVYSASLKKISARAGSPGAYHETITVAFLALIAERGAVGDYDYADFDRLLAANADLADKRVLYRWYAAERLDSALARRTFILPAATR